nr:unnamed protein product [Callosobruchus analis]
MENVLAYKRTDHIITFVQFSHYGVDMSSPGSRRTWQMCFGVEVQVLHSSSELFSIFSPTFSFSALFEDDPIVSSVEVYVIWCSDRQAFCKEKRSQFALLVSHLLWEGKRCLSISVAMIIGKRSPKCRSSKVFHDNLSDICDEHKLKSIADVLADCTSKWVGVPVFSRTIFIFSMSG